MHHCTGFHPTRLLLTMAVGQNNKHCRRYCAPHSWIQFCWNGFKKPHAIESYPFWQSKMEMEDANTVDTGYTICCLYFLQGHLGLTACREAASRNPLQSPSTNPQKHLCQSKKIRVRRTSQRKNRLPTKQLRALEDKHSSSPGRRPPPLLGNVWKRNHFLIEMFGMANEEMYPILARQVYHV